MSEPRVSDEEYLATLYELAEDGVPTIRARMSERMGISAAATSEGVERLRARGYLVDSDDRRLRLTPAGQLVAETVIRRHRLAERLLVDVLGLPWEKAHEEATRWEHIISDDVEERLVDLLGDPATCPHGNAIPGSARKPDTADLVLLADVRAGSVTIGRISEQVQLDDEALRLLSAGRLLPGCAATVQGSGQHGMELRTAVGDVSLPVHVTEQVWVLRSMEPVAGENPGTTDR